MKKVIVILSLILFCSLCVNAQEYSTVCANHILVPTEMDAIKIKSQIKTFEDFKYYAKMYSTCPSSKNGGDLGCFERGQMVKPFEEASFEGTVGEVSNPVETRFGYHLIWVRDKY